MSLFGSDSDETREPTPEQDVEYKLVDTTKKSPFSTKGGGHVKEEKFNELARKGWHYAGDIQKMAGTTQVIFEREVEVNE